MSRRAPETLADYVVVGIAPALIMLLIGSLVFFLIGVFYQGEFPYRLSWVMGLFVLATVCVARISMEEGAGYAALFGLPLGVVVGIAVVYFVRIEGPLAPFSALINWSLLALVWWCAHQLTWDCTLIDERSDTTGQGLLQSMGWDRSRSGASADRAATGSETPASEKPLWWQRWFQRERQPAAHGRWVVYFSVAALPLFGLGQFFIPVGDIAARRFAFWMLVVYVGSGLGLLLTTSFLGLRRYIRQRQLEMPVEMAATWLSVGVAMILGLLIVGALLPRPAPEYSLADSIQVRLGTFTSPARDASSVGFGPEGTKSDRNAGSHTARISDSTEQVGTQKAGSESTTSTGANDGDQQASGGESSGDGEKGSGTKSEGRTPKGGEPSASGQKPTKGSSSAAPGDQTDPQTEQRSGPGESSKPGSSTGGQSNAKPRASSEPASQQQSDTPPAEPGKSNPPASSGAAPPPRSPPLIRQWGANLGNLLRLLFYAVLAVVALVLAWRYRHELIVAWRQLLKELGELWRRWFGGSTAEPGSPSAAPPAMLAKNFRDFSDPFASGLAQRMTPSQLVHYSFEALQAWARDFAAPRETGQTPHEFSEALARQQPALDMPARQLAEIYSRMAYARQTPPTQTAAVLQNLWRAMLATSVQPLSGGTADKSVGSA